MAQSLEPRSQGLFPEIHVVSEVQARIMKDIYWEKALRLTGCEKPSKPSSYVPKYELHAAVYALKYGNCFRLLLYCNSSELRKPSEFKGLISSKLDSPHVPGTGNGDNAEINGPMNPSSLKPSAPDPQNDILKPRPRLRAMTSEVKGKKKDGWKRPRNVGTLL